MKKICKISGREFEITDDDLAFYEKMGVPAPTLCPEERERRRLAWRNERSLYKRKCDCCKDSIISVFSADTKYIVYCPKCWRGDSWEGKSYGVDFDFSRSFFDQFQEFFQKVPQLGLVVSLGNENCDYCNFGLSNKNGFLSYSCGYCEDFYFCHTCKSSQNIMDCLRVDDSELCYDCLDCQNGYQLSFSQNCKQCSDSFFLENCQNCQHCFGGKNLKNKKFYIFHISYSETEYFEKLKELIPLTYEDIEKQKEKCRIFFKKFPQRENQNISVENCTGDFIIHSKDCIHGFDIMDVEKCSYCSSALKIHDCLDIDFAAFCEFLYECIGSGPDFENKFCRQTKSAKNLEYCMFCSHSQNLFGCVGLQHAQYYIFNKQYTPEEYFALRKKITEHMKKLGEYGEFFPIEISPFGYNETYASDLYPLPKKEVLSRGYKWKENLINYTTQTYSIPNTISEVPDNICKEILACKKTGKNYKIQKFELDFYRKMNLPIPTLCQDVRHVKRMALRNPRKLWNRKCDKCGVGIETTFAIERKEKVYCEKCYLSVIN